MYVFFSEVAKVGIKPIKSYIQRMETEGISRAVIIVQDGMTPAAKQVLLRLCNCALFTQLNAAVEVILHLCALYYRDWISFHRPDLIVKTLEKLCDIAETAYASLPNYTLID